MALPDVLRGLAGAFLLAGFIALIVIRVTPIAWFPWDVLTMGALFVIGFALFGASNRVGVDDPPSPRAQPLPVLFSWILGSSATAMIALHFWPYEHSLGALIFLGIVTAGVVAGILHRNAIRRRSQRRLRDAV